MLPIPALLVGVCLAAPPQVVRFEAIMEQPPPAAVVQVHTTWLGEARTATLRDNGQPPDVRARDGVWTASLSGEALRILPVTLTLDPGDGQPLTLAATSEILNAGEDTLTWAIGGAAPYRARRVAVALPTRSAEFVDIATVIAALGWIALVLGWVMWLAGRVRRGRR